MNPRALRPAAKRLTLSDSWRYVIVRPLGPSISVAGQDVPSFSSRKVKTRLRLREGESNLLAGLLRDDQRKQLTGFPGVINVPVLRSLFGASQDTINQTDIVMLLTPHIVRTHELSADDLARFAAAIRRMLVLLDAPRG